MEDQLLVAKTLLLCYPHLEDLCLALSKCSEESVESGFYAIFPNEQMRLYERICAYEKRKVGAYNMKFLVEECFRRGKGISLSLLKEKFLLKRSMGELIRKYDISLRTAYRHIKKGLAAMANTLKEMGFSKKRILCEYGNEPLFLTMLNRVIKEDDAETAGEGGEKELNHRHLPICLLGREHAFSEDGRARRV